MISAEQTEQRIYKLIPESSPDFEQVRLYLNSLLRLNTADTSSPVYHPPLDWPEPTITQEQLAELHQHIVSKQLRVRFPASAYIGSLGLADDNATLEHAMDWAAMNAHVLLSLAGMDEREDLLRVLCTRFRLPLSTPNRYGWLWSTLPKIECNWKQLTELLESQKKDPFLNNDAVNEIIPSDAYARLGEIHHAYDTALTKKAKIDRFNAGPRQKLKFPYRLPLTPEADSTLHRLSFPIKNPVLQVNQDEQRFDDPQTERLIDASKDTPEFIKDSAAAQAFTTRLTSAHIARRSFELYSEPSILLPEQVQALFSSLHTSITDSTYTNEDHQADVLILISLLTSTAIKDLQSIKSFINSKHIVSYKNKKNSNNLLWKVDLEVPSSGRKYHQHHLERNKKFFYLPLPPLLHGTIKNGLHASDKLKNIEDRIKFHANRSGIVLLSAGRIASALHTIIRRHTDDKILADLICGYSPKHSSALYYSSYSSNEIFRIYKKSISFLSANTNLNLDYLSFKLNISSGSQSLLTVQAATDFMSVLLQSANNSKDKINKHNALTCWLWYAILLLTSIRPVNHIPGMLSQIDLETGLLWVSDKEARSTSAGRIVPICDFLNRAIKGYLNYLNDLKTSLGLEDATLADILDQLEHSKYPLLFFRTEAAWEAAQPVHIIKLTEGLPVYPLNWTRHFGRSFLSGLQPDFIINAAFGHEDPDQETLNPFSSMPLQQIKQLAGSYDKLADSLQLKLPNGWCEV